MYEINILDTNYIYIWKIFDIICESMQNFVGAPHVECWPTVNYNVCCVLCVFGENYVCGEVSWTPLCEIIYVGG